jgi:hypothetical protein
MGLPRLTAHGRFAIADRHMGPTRLVSAFVGIGLLVASSGCRRGARTPAAAFLRFEEAVSGGDLLAIYDCLDSVTRASVQSVHSDERLMRTLVIAKYPETEQARELARLQPEEPSPGRYFARTVQGERLLDGWQRRLGTKRSALIERKESDRSVSIGRQDGTPFIFCDADGTWNFCELQSTWLAHKERAHHAKKTVQENAALYQRAERQ